MLNLLDELTTEDKEKIGAYIDLYGSFGLERKSVDELLSVWAKNKTKLYHWLGNSLRVQFPFVNEDILKEEVVNKIYRTFSDYNTYDSKYDNALRNMYNKFREYYKESNEKNKYFQKIAEENKESLSIISSWRYTFVRETTKEMDKLRSFIDLIFSEHCFVDGMFDIDCKITITADGKKYQFQNGEKIWKTLKKLHQIFPDAITNKEFEDARILYSTWFNDKKKGYLTISIHPLDFMTMSDNASKWKSCMSWKDQGCYRIGTIEMMNSNNVFCVYYTSKKEDTGFSFGDYEWNDKKWRSLIIATKDIIVANKAYPYCSKETNIAIIDKIKELAKENMGYTYEFGPELYKDMDHIMTDCYLDDVSNSIANRTEGLRKNIYFKSVGMYNDMLHNIDNYEYWCYRNKVKTKKLISYSGKSECMCCGKTDILKYIGFDEGIHNYRNVASTLCKECEDLTVCPNCGSFAGTNIVKITYDGKKRTFCQTCGSSIISCPICNKNYVEREGLRICDYYYNRSKREYCRLKIFVIKDDKIKTFEEEKDKFEKDDSSSSNGLLIDDKLYEDDAYFTPCCKSCYEEALKNKKFIIVKKKPNLYNTPPIIFATESQFSEVYPGKEESYKATTFTNIFGKQEKVLRKISYSYLLLNS